MIHFILPYCACVRAVVVAAAAVAAECVFISFRFAWWYDFDTFRMCSSLLSVFFFSFEPALSDV